jgi:hypothetical protein
MTAGTVLSIGVFFSLLIAGLARSLPTTLGSGLQAAGVPADAAQRAAELPPVGSVFAAFLGFNPVEALLGPSVLAQLPPDQAARITGQQFFPQLISDPVHSGLVVVFLAAAGLALVAAVASALRGGRYVHADSVTAVVEDGAVTETPAPPVAAEPERSAAGADGARQVAGAADGRRSAGAADARQVAGAADGRRSAEAADARQVDGASVSARLAP